MSSFFRMHITTHLDGLHAALVNFRIGELWIGRDEEIPAFKSLVEEAHSRGIRVVNKEGEHSSSTAGTRRRQRSNVTRTAAATPTDRDGAITTVTDGRGLFVHRYNDP
jgi:hypothetical protein